MRAEDGGTDKSNSPRLIPFSTINKLSESVKRCNFTLIIEKKRELKKLYYFANRKEKRA